MLAVSRYQASLESGSDMGMAAGTGKRAYEVFLSCQGIIGKIPPDYKSNFEKKLAGSEAHYKKAEEKARRLAAREERRRREAERAALSATPPPKPAVSPSALDGW